MLGRSHWHPRPGVVLFVVFQLFSSRIDAQQRLLAITDIGQTRLVLSN